MKKIEIFDPAMCCPTGLCGPNINPDLMRHGADGLPVTLVDGTVTVRKGYPTNDQLTEWTGVSLDYIPILKKTVR